MPRIKSRIDVIDRDLAVTLPEISEPEQAKLLQDFARQELGKALRQNKAVLGVMPDYETRVDGTPAQIERAKSTSVIDFEFELATEMFRWISEMLVLNSPVGKTSDPRPDHPGLYARSHVFFIDGVAYDPEGPVQMPQQEAVFVNVQPYARKMERGLSSQAPDGVYEVVAAMARRRFGNYGDIRFSYRTPYEFGSIHEWANTTSMASPYRRGEKRDEWLRRQPAIVIRV
jgi:hypothetical protein